MTTVDRCPVAFPLRRPGQTFPPPEYQGFRASTGLVSTTLPSGVPVWLVTRHEDVRKVLTDTRISSNPSHPGFPRAAKTGGVPSQDEVPGWFVALDPPEHGRFRKTLIPEFTVRKVREMRPAIQQIVDERIDAMLAAGDTADLIADFALSVPSLVISSLLGVPNADRDFFETKTRVLVTLTSTDEQRQDASRALLRYLNRLIAVKQKRPGDDLISQLLAEGSLSRQELSGVAMLLLIAGHETTANNIGLGVVTLLSHPQWIGDERAVEELLRYYSVADLVCFRVAVEDVEIGGQLIRAGEGIIPLVAAANHDGTVFERPDEFDPSRSARSHVAFGYGVHQCLGQNLVRVEMDIAYRTLFERIPTLELAVPVEELPLKYDGVLYGLHALPVRW
ncbi:cytochrome [Streptomyces sp. CB00316]|uniref:cytochrome P450 n=1 Tax=unclassified Streptomyces TaxID=2593676 RepID=UPI00093D5EEE|nr:MULTISPECIES: cytochrome P450 [unclassified Streptomyces]MBT2381812.1 cytochrome P450 [Streptomyces sp. ISL-111]MBT2427742.1 cytochrome P450 [Streptomyces sp. ISL-112]MBT2463564.1 cytochrome P450 [Streptomyces sp. ISL-63]OKJ08046.1 cytochrome [Streptomyces sp. CB00316]